MVYIYIYLYVLYIMYIYGFVRMNLQGKIAVTVE